MQFIAWYSCISFHSAVSPRGTRTGRRARRCFHLMSIPLMQLTGDALAQHLQCADSGVPMICTTPKVAPLFHLHIPKTAGRTIAQMLIHESYLFGQPFCWWGPVRPDYFPISSDYSGYGPHLVHDYGNWSNFAHELIRHRDDVTSHPCSTTFELSFNEGKRVWSAAGVEPLTMTFLREPSSWLFSAIQHDYQLVSEFHPLYSPATNSSVIDTMQNSPQYKSCFSPPPATGSMAPPRRQCGGYHLHKPPMLMFLAPELTHEITHDAISAEHTQTSPPDSSTGNRSAWSHAVQTARHRIDHMLVGMASEVPLSICLFAFQLGQLKRASAAHQPADPYKLRERCRCSGSSSPHLQVPRVGEHGSSGQSLLGDATPRARAVINAILASPGYRADASLFRYGVWLFVERVRVAERRLGMQMLCEDTATRLRGAIFDNTHTFNTTR